MAEPICVRFAPSPTGFLHVGGARTALFNWLLARRHGGQFRLRIEDTDLERSTEESVRHILDGLRWLGLDWDGDEVYQSRQRPRHEETARQLLASGHAYRCFCPPERIDELRKQAEAQKQTFLYDGLCRRLTEEESRRRAEAGEPFSIRFHVPQEGVTEVDDLIRGHVRVDHGQMGDFVIVRTDGAPVFLLANVVDDHDMGITEIVRGEDHLTNTPRQILLYKALGWTPPRFAHVPMILGPDKQRLSKRHGAVSVLAYRDEGYLPEALVNFLALLGWSLDDKSDFMTVDQIVENFSLERVNKSAAVFDLDKLAWLNGKHFRALGEAECARRAMDYMKAHGPDPRDFDSQWLARVIILHVERANTLKDLVAAISYLLFDDLEFDEKAVAKHLQKDAEAPRRLNAVIEILRAAPDFHEATLDAPMRALMEKEGVGFGKIAQPMRVALTGGAASPGIFEVLDLLGKERALKRLEYARDHLCGS